MTEYYIPTGDGEAEFVEKRSSFLGHVRLVETEEEANDFADWKAKQLRKYGYEFHVRVYKLIG